jgi:hypothetical protein
MIPSGIEPSDLPAGPCRMTYPCETLNIVMDLKFLSFFCKGCQISSHIQPANTSKHFFYSTKRDCGYTDPKDAGNSSPCVETVDDMGLITLNVDSHTTCRAHVVPLPCRAFNGLECVFPI